MIDDPRIEVVLSTPLVKEYEDVLSRGKFALNSEDVKDIKDDMVLKLAVKANAMIITHNKKDFTPVSKFNLPVLLVSEFLHILGEI